MNEKSYYIAYRENGHLVEDETLTEVNDIRDWFYDSVEHHTGKKPSEMDYHYFLNGEPHTITDGCLEMEWTLVA